MDSSLTWVSMFSFFTVLFAFSFLLLTSVLFTFWFLFIILDTRMKILNLYSGIGGNRKLWGDEHDITAVEYNPEIAKIYKDFFPKDKVVVTDAHQYLLDHYKEYDFIWSSPPCPTHSRFNFLSNEQEGKNMKYPDMTLYQEIIFLKYWFKGKWCVENVISYYEPLIPPMLSSSHYFWTNFLFRPLENIKRGIKRIDEEDIKREEYLGISLEKYKFKNKRQRRQLINNCCEPEIGQHILHFAIHPIEIQKKLL